MITVYKNGLVPMRAYAEICEGPSEAIQKCHERKWWSCRTECQMKPQHCGSSAFRRRTIRPTGREHKQLMLEIIVRSYFQHRERSWSNPGPIS
jgi:hypothetical protein